MRALRVGACLTLLWVTTVHAGHPCGQLDLAPIDWLEFEGAVLRIQGEDPKVSGTGYLISSSQGYVLTAQHVVEQSVAGVVEATSPRRPGKVFKATIVADLSTATDPVDVALLQLSDTDALSDIRSLDISLRMPSRREDLYTIGYPKFGDMPNTTQQSIKLQNPSFLPGQGYIQTNDAIAKPGASGSPLIDMYGSTVGTAVKTLGIDEKDAWFVPTASLRPLLDKIPPSKKARDLEDMLKTNSVTEATLRDMLLTSGKITNLDLYGLVRLIQNDKDAALISKELLSCPLSYALEARGLIDLVLDPKWADGLSQSEAYLNVAERDLALNNSVLAVAHGQKAVEGFKLIGDSANLRKSQLVLARAQYQSGAFSSAKSTLGGVLKGEEGLSLEDKGEAYLLAGEIEAKSGSLTLATAHLQKASAIFVGQTDFDQAARANRLAANLNFRQGRLAAATRSSDDATSLYKRSGNVQGQADSLYEKAKIQVVSGDHAGLKDTANEYMKLAPTGAKAAELKAAGAVANEPTIHAIEF